MSGLTMIAVLVVALLHVVFLVLEMFLWSKPVGRRIFGTKQDFARETSTLAANQGLYNGFLAVGLLLSLFLGAQGHYLQLYLLVCVIVAGVYGAVTVKRSILWIQAMPGLLALLLAMTTGS